MKSEQIFGHFRDIEITDFLFFSQNLWRLAKQKMV